MTRHVAATAERGLATFLLEMALDRSRIKARFAAMLLDERTARGDGDARRFPQPEMAKLLGYSLRQYQRLEDPDNASMPGWRGINNILATLGRDEDDVFTSPGENKTPPASADVQEQLWEALAMLRDIRSGQRELADRVKRLEESASRGANTQSHHGSA